MKFTPEKKLRLWIAGDSLVVVPGESVLRAVAGNRALDAADAIDGRIASGLERPDVFNWFTHVREVMETRKPRAVVLMFGGNDDHGFMTGIPRDATSGTFGSPTWRAEYRRRVATVMDTVTSRGGYLVWIGLPISRDADQTLRFDLINSIVQTEAAEAEGPGLVPRHVLLLRRRRRRLRAVRRGRDRQAREDASRRRRPLRTRRGRSHRATRCSSASTTATTSRRGGRASRLGQCPRLSRARRGGASACRRATVAWKVSPTPTETRRPRDRRRVRFP